MLTVGVLRELLRHYQAFAALYESDGVDTLTGPEGDSYSLWDLQYLVEEIVDRLPPRQAQAIRLCLVENHREVDVALMMGVAPTNPVAMYASTGLATIVGWIEDGSLDRFKPERTWA